MEEAKQVKGVTDPAEKQKFPVLKKILSKLETGLVFLLVKMLFF